MGSFLLQAPLPFCTPHGFVWETDSLWCFSYLSFGWGTGRIEHLISQVPAQDPVSHINGQGSKMMKTHFAELGSIVWSSVGLWKFPFLLISISVHHWVTWKWVEKYRFYLVVTSFPTPHPNSFRTWSHFHPGVNLFLFPCFCILISLLGYSSGAHISDGDLFVI